MRSYRMYRQCGSRRPYRPYRSYRPCRSDSGSDYADKLADAMGAGFDFYTAMLYARGSFRLSRSRAGDNPFPTDPDYAGQTDNSTKLPDPIQKDSSGGNANSQEETHHENPPDHALPRGPSESQTP